MTIRDKIQLMRRSGEGQGYLKYATGYPLTLTKTLAKPPESVTVYGNTGGVGDYDTTKQAYKIPILLQGRNLFDKNNISVLDGYLSYNGSGAYTNQKYVASHESVDCIYIPCKPNTTYTAYKGDYNPSGSLFRFGSSAIVPPVRMYNGGQPGDITDYTNGVPSDKTVTHTTGENDTYLFLTISGWGLGLQDYTDLTDVLMIVEGAYTADTMPPYEPYINKTINLYSDVALDEGDSLVVNSKTKTAMRGSTDVWALQDWTQDMKLPKSEELTVTAGTTVAPSDMEIAYWSSIKD